MSRPAAAPGPLDEPRGTTDATWTGSRLSPQPPAATAPCVGLPVAAAARHGSPRGGATVRAVA
ncbi:hypothetical protein JS521_35790, partial [Streptomyces sp. RHZ10]|nr:hypothetical protein [Streptomyces durocortorensis]